MSIKSISIARVMSSALMLVFLSGCVSMDNHRASIADPDERLDQLMAVYSNINGEKQGCHELKRAYSSTTDCKRIQGEVQRLHMEFPENERVLMANAVLQLQAGRYDRAQFLLDQLLSQPGAHPEAALLRSQLAVREGNTARARTLLKQQIVLRPDYAELREALASTYYLEGKYDDARKTLYAAGRLGVSGWRIAYHQGLLSEAQEDWAGACQFYLRSLEQKPDFRQAVARLVGLTEHAACRDIADAR